MKPNDHHSKSGKKLNTRPTRRKVLARAAMAPGLIGLASMASLPAFAQQAPGSPTPAGSVPLALKLARLFHATSYPTLPAGTVQNAKMILASTLASAASGTRIESARIIRELSREQGGHAEASVWYDSARLPLPSAARVNAMLSDAAASDDSDLRNVAHTGTALTALSLAIGDRTGASGKDVLSAMVTGYEAAGRFGDIIRGGRPGLHASMVVAFGGVVAASKLLGLTPEQMAHAISITSVTMGGILIGTDSWAREYQAGNAALCAINAALAARRGFTVNDDLLEAKGGFIDTYGNPKVDLKNVTRDLGREWDISKFLAIKLVPGAHALHSSMEAAIQAAKEGNVSPDDVAKIVLSGPPKTSVTFDTRPPKDMVEAIHSLPYFVASAVADKDFSWVHITPEKIHSPVVARLIGLVEYDNSPSSIHYDWNWGGTVTIVTKSGARYTKTVDAPRGSGPRGIEWGDVERKYNALMPDSGLPAKRITEILRTIHDFDRLNQVAALTRLLH
jgi:2-methylcitrate dehydratase PrpD